MVKRVKPRRASTAKVRPAPTRADEPIWRKLTILAQDPELRGGSFLAPVLSRITIPAEPFLPGPCSARVKVVDYNASEDRFYDPLPDGYDLNGEPADPFEKVKPRAIARLLQDPHFHQQQVYAVAMRMLCQFERALGRRVDFGFDDHQLHIAPHAFAEANAFYSRESRALFFGYFRNAKNRWVFTCLSHDIIAHEMAHALLDGIKPRYVEPASPDQAAFHEGFADIVALLVVLSDQRLIEALMAQHYKLRIGNRLIKIDAITRKALGETALLGLAESMGTPLSDGRATALRRSVKLKPNKRWLTDPEFEEPHDRGEILVAAVMNAFLSIWLLRLSDIGEVQPGFADAKRVAQEGATAAEHLLMMAIRALDYCPPIDIEFADYLSALLTADSETMPGRGRDPYRDEIRTSFAAWGLLPASRPKSDGQWLAFSEPLSYSTIRFEALQRSREEAFRFLWRNAKSLRIVNNVYTKVNGVRPIARVAHDGLIVRETVVDYIQIRSVRGNELEALGLTRPREMPAFREVRLFGGGVLIFDEYGRLKFSIGNGLNNMPRQQKRLDHLARAGYFGYPSDQAFTKGFFSRLHLSLPGRR